VTGKEIIKAEKANLPSTETLKTVLATAKSTGEVKPIITAAKALMRASFPTKQRSADVPTSLGDALREGQRS
jgi:hypothetical protein